MDGRFTIWIFGLPLAVFIVNAAFGHKMPNRMAGWIAVAGMAGSALLAWVQAWHFFSTAETAVKQHYFTWLQLTSEITVTIGLYADRLTWMMTVVVTTVSLLVFIYSVDYMKHEPGYARFFAFLSLFVFSMLGLVAAPNLIQLYMCWELVGLSSYLLIGFYYTRPAAVDATKKAFIVTRFADFGFLTGMLLLSGISGTIEVDKLILLPETMHQHATAFLGLSSFTWALGLIFVGGAGKSAMFPLHIWLPDAMEGPTPVSALIHAATMVVAGVFLVARLFPMYTAWAPSVLDLIAWVGMFSMLFAALIACVQTDIKRILAYSTMSQIGYMMLALGAGAYHASLFHLFTHAFFKALLFLAAGVIIHAAHTQHINTMRGLRKALPATHALFLIGCLAISGIPPLAGFFSKEAIFHAVFMYSPVHFYMALLGAGLTAFYMFRLYVLAFLQPPAVTHNFQHASAVMLAPMVVLGVASATAGFVPFAALLQAEHEPATFHAFMPWATTAVSVTGIAAALILFRNKNTSPRPDNRLLTLLENKFFIDELYLFITKNIIFKKLALPIAWFDRHVVDGAVNTTARIIRQLAETIKFIQSGQVQQYAWVFMTGTVALLLMVLLMM